MTDMTQQTEINQITPLEEDAEDEAVLTPEIPIGIVLARILIVSAMSFSAALAIFCVVGAIWPIAGLAAIATLFFLALMFAVERVAER
jgi:predicted anti-sigma-YlaC factor YlaD